MKLPRVADGRPNYRLFEVNRIAVRLLMVKATKAARILSPRSSWSRAKFFHRRLTSKRNTGQPLTNLCNYEFLSDSRGRRRRSRRRRRRKRRRRRRRRRERREEKREKKTDSNQRNDCNELDVLKGVDPGFVSTRWHPPLRMFFTPCMSVREKHGRKNGRSSSIDQKSTGTRALYQR